MSAKRYSTPISCHVSYVVWHHPDVIVLRLILSRVAKEDALLFGPEGEIIERERKLDIRYGGVGVGRGYEGAVHLGERSEDALALVAIRYVAFFG